MTALTKGGDRQWSIMRQAYVCWNCAISIVRRKTSLGRMARQNSASLSDNVERANEAQEGSIGARGDGIAIKPRAEAIEAVLESSASVRGKLKT